MAAIAHSDGSVTVIERDQDGDFHVFDEMPDGSMQERANLDRIIHSLASLACLHEGTIQLRGQFPYIMMMVAQRLLNKMTAVIFTFTTKCRTDPRKSGANSDLITPGMS